LHAFAVGIDNEEVAFLVLSPETTLLQVNSVDTASALEWHSEQLKEVVVVCCSELLLLTDAIEERSFICSDEYYFTVLSDFDH
jgi:hypothetical protein